MVSTRLISLFLCTSFLFAAPTVKTSNGALAGTTSSDGKVNIFKGIPFAAPPVGQLRWKSPQPAQSWEGVKPVTSFGARCMQARVFDDMVFRDSGPSEDCLYLNVWTPAASAHGNLPVMVWIYGGGFVGGAASEPRQDGEQLAKKGVVVVSFNYRLGIFGFYAHPELAKESDHKAAGNYGLLDQLAALKWVHQNIASFGGNPANVTIFGESAGSFSVSALIASPLTTGLFQRAIGESGAYFGPTLRALDLKHSSADGLQFGKDIGSTSLAALRAQKAADLLQEATTRKKFKFVPNVDGYFLPTDIPSIYAAGKQQHIPLLAGWNADEGSYGSIFHGQEPTVDNYVASLHKMFGDEADALVKAYPAANDAQAKESAQDLAGDQFIAYSTWKWLEAQGAIGNSKLFRYRFEDAPPADPTNPKSASRGAYHSAEIEFVFEALKSKKLPWRSQDEKLSDMIATYWSNFAKTGDPNGAGLAKWPQYSKQDGYQVMHLDASPHAAPDKLRTRYQTLESLKAFKPTAN
jgi:para-nitrobenzyl esterase